MGRRRKDEGEKEGKRKGQKDRRTEGQKDRRTEGQNDRREKEDTHAGTVVAPEHLVKRGLAAGEVTREQTLEEERLPSEPRCVRASRKPGTLRTYLKLCLIQPRRVLQRAVTGIHRWSTRAHTHITHYHAHDPHIHKYTHSTQHTAYSHEDTTTLPQLMHTTRAHTCTHAST